MLDSMLSWMQTTPVAVAISQSLTVNALLSSMHVLGITSLVGSVLVSSLRLMGAVLVAWSSDEVTRATRRGAAIGLSITVVTGVLLVSPRAPNAAVNTFFQTKMLLLVTATVFHLTAYRRASVTTRPGRRSIAVGAVGLALWLGVVLAGAAFILLE